MKTIRLTMAQALIRFLDQQYISLDDQEHKFVHGVMGIFGHGNVNGIGEALENEETQLPFIQGHNEQGMVHAAIAFAKQKNRLGIYACTSSIGPGATNMVTGAATATASRLPVLLLPGDTFACRQPAPVLQQVERPHDYTITVNDCFKPVSRYWDRIERPEQVMTALLNAFRVLTDPVDCGAVTICLPQDVQTEAYDYPVEFFNKRTYYIDRRPLGQRALTQAVNKIVSAKRPLIIAGGGVKYSLASDTLREFARQFAIPVAETQAGKGSLCWQDEMSMGGIGVTGNQVANRLSQQADVILAIGTRLSDFTTASKSGFAADATLLQLNVSTFDGMKMDAAPLQADAKQGLLQLQQALQQQQYKTSVSYQQTIAQWRNEWHAETERLFSIDNTTKLAQTTVIGELNQFMADDDVIIGAAGSLPGDLQRLWRSTNPASYHMEYAYSCMGYEVAAGLGVKLAEPQRDVYVLLGDGSFLMLHSELLTSIQERKKMTIVLLDNNGFGCIKGLQMSQGSRGFGNDFSYRQENSGQLDGQSLTIDFAAYAQSLGAISYRVATMAEFKQALVDAKQQQVTTLIDVKVEPGSMSPGYESWWRVGVAEVSNNTKVTQAHQQMAKKIKTSKVY